MPKITKIVHKIEKERYWIYVDNEYCTSVRERTFPALNLLIGQEISCDKIKELENHHWKHSYGVTSWEKEKYRLLKVKSLIEGLDERIKVKVEGFGADSNDFIGWHPEESGKPDLVVVTKDKEILIIKVEVSGTETMRGNTYWIRPDKIKYAQKYPEQDIWLVLHYNQPEKFVFIKPNLSFDYKISKKLIRNATEYYIEFNNESSEIVEKNEFVKYIINKINNLT